MIEKSSTKEKLILRRVASIILVAGTAWVIFEWLFFVTKPSFMSLYSPWEKAGVLSSTAFIISAALLLGSLPFVALAWLVNHVTTPRIPLSLVVFMPAILHACFTYP